MFESLTDSGSRNKDRFIVIIGLATLVVISWAYLMYVSNGMSDMDMAHGSNDGMGMSVMKPDLPMPWVIGDWVSMFVMWTVMMIGMMIPSASPMILLFSRVNRQKKDGGKPYVGTFIFVFGYVVIWGVFSALATILNYLLHSNSLMSGMMGQSDSMLFAGCLLIAAGIFQWTPLKNACLTKCRTPMGFLMTEWREGPSGAWAMGLKHGIYCVACCWLIMALLFVLGVMNLVWIAVLSLFVLIEKIVPNGLWVGRVSGIALIVWGALLLVNI